MAKIWSASVPVKACAVKYWAEGGNADLLELDAYVHEALKPHPSELILLTWAMDGLRL